MMSHYVFYSPYTHSGKRRDSVKAGLWFQGLDLFCYSESACSLVGLCLH